MMNRRSPPQVHAGFSLIEISLVLVIAGLALGGLLAALGPQLEHRKYSGTQRQLKEASEALVAFAMVHRRLPCPATATSNGQEALCTNANVPGACGATVNSPATLPGAARGRCAAAANAGLLPAVTLGLGGTSTQGPLAGTLPDQWGNPIRYRVSATPNIAGPPVLCTGTTPCFPYTQQDGMRNAWYGLDASTGTRTMTGTPTTTLSVCGSATGITGGNCGTALQLAVPAFVVYSYGRNVNAGAIGADEAANVDANDVYVFHDKTEASAPNGAFDDLFEWVTPAQLIARMQGNGVLP